MNRGHAISRDSPALVVAIGASAGGLDVCKKLLADMRADQDIAFVVVMHLDPAQQSHITEILGKVTRMEVAQVAGAVRVEPNRVYVIAPATSLGIRDGVLQVEEPQEPHYLAKPIDAFFSALAADQGGRAVGIVLSGAGSDGSAGLRDIHARGGLCLVQDPATAQYDSMPTSAVDTGVADAVLPPEEMGKVILDYARPSRARPPPREREETATEPALQGLDGILALLGKQYGIDFGDYKRGTLERRASRRMDIAQIATWQDYLDYLRAHTDEVAALYGDVLIDVTRFFRDPRSWEHLEHEIAPKLIEVHDCAMPVRLWSAGCATGEEAYSLAMVFVEQIEKQGNRCNLQVFGSDLSHDALAFARRGLYPASIEEDISPARLERFFHRVGAGFQVTRSLRDRVTFAAHNLLSDPPFANLDLTMCRNVLIYLEPHAQERLLELFHFSLRSRGVLWLGSSETVGRRSDLFETLSSEHRMYRPVQIARATQYHFPRWIAARSAEQGARPERAAPQTRSKMTRALEQLMLRRYTAPAVAITRSLEILHFFGRTEAYLQQPSGEARMDLLSWVRPGLYARLRAGLLEAMTNNQRVVVTDMRIERDAATARAEAIIEPMTSPGMDGVFLVCFRDSFVPREPTDLAAQEGRTNESLVRDLDQELQNTRQELQGAVEQLETANEEYRVSHEELLSLNEELQSSNEELEMSKEEQQSLNEELTTVNRQLEERNEELRTLTRDLNNLLVSADVPTLFLDRHFGIRRFTPACTGLMRIVDTDVGRSLDHIKMQVRDDSLHVDVERVLDKLVPIEAEVSTDDGRWFVRRVLPYRTEDDRIDGVCITFHDVSAQKRAAAESEEARRFAEAIIRSSRTPMLVLDAGLRVVMANREFFETFQVGKDETVGKRVYELGNHQWDMPGLRVLLEEVLPREKDIRNYDVEYAFETIGWRAMRLNASIIATAGRDNLILVALEDITDLRNAEAAARRRAEALLEDHRRKDEFLAMLGHELRNPMAALTSGIELVRRSSADAARVEQVGATMARQTRRITAMLDQLLDVSRVISGKLELARDAVDVTDVVRSAIDTVTPMVESARQVLTVSLPPEGSMLVLGDGLRLAQVVENLLVNASKYTESRGHIWVTAGATDESVHISVRDTGIGMDPDFLEHAFELFTQAPRGLDRAKGGLGLGLPIVRSLVALHGGQVEARSDGLGKGCELVVTLPRLRSGRVTQTPDVDLRPRAIPARRVLVVEDEEDTATMLMDILALEGQDVRVAHDGASALEVARQFHPDVVLLDLGLPATDGYEVAATLRGEHGKDMLLVAMTGYQRDAERLEASGFDEHLLKPLDLDRLLDLLAGRGARNEARDGA